MDNRENTSLEKNDGRNSLAPTPVTQTPPREIEETPTGVVSGSRRKQRVTRKSFRVERRTWLPLLTRTLTWNKMTAVVIRRPLTMIPRGSGGVAFHVGYDPRPARDSWSNLGRKNSARGESRWSGGRAGLDVAPGRGLVRRLWGRGFRPREVCPEV